MPIVDIHTHVYTPFYMSHLRQRDTIPYVRSYPPNAELRLVILPGEDDPSTPSTSHGRPIGPDYYDIAAKISFMDKHGIDISVLSLANPWLDVSLVSPTDVAAMAIKCNDELNDWCELYPGRLYAFGTLPMSGSAEEIVAEVKRLKGLKWMRGVICGSIGMGKGLDDLRLEPVWQALQEAEMTLFLHPHYGIGKELYGPRNDEYGHVLNLAISFPIETTIAVSRMVLSGVFDRWQKLSILMAHSGGALPFLAGRLESCILHDSHLKKTGKLENRRDIWDILKTNILLDAVIYSEAGLKAAVHTSGAERVMFGTDHPFFPPLEGDESQEWLSVTMNSMAIQNSLETDVARNGVLGGNAVRHLKLYQQN
ncbi:uracil-5-carboxylate decarboxylase [Geopyxis carbonaria]|nr:uracil-5-carboxylate decarboxylase [Geopyxis carbonaria]